MFYLKYIIKLKIVKSIIYKVLEYKKSIISVFSYFLFLLIIFIQNKVVYSMDFITFFK